MNDRSKLTMRPEIQDLGLRTTGKKEDLQTLILTAWNQNMPNQQRGVYRYKYKPCIRSVESNAKIDRKVKIG